MFFHAAELAVRIGVHPDRDRRAVRVAAGQFDVDQTAGADRLVQRAADVVVDRFDRHAGQPDDQLVARPAAGQGEAGDEAVERPDRVADQRAAGGTGVTAHRRFDLFDETLDRHRGDSAPLQPEMDLAAGDRLRHRGGQVFDGDGGTVGVERLAGDDQVLKLRTGSGQFGLFLGQREVGGVGVLRFLVPSLLGQVGQIEQTVSKAFDGGQFVVVAGDHLFASHRIDRRRRRGHFRVGERGVVGGVGVDQTGGFERSLNGLGRLAAQDRDQDDQHADQVGDDVEEGVVARQRGVAGRAGHRVVPRGSAATRPSTTDRPLPRRYRQIAAAAGPPPGSIRRASSGDHWPPATAGPQEATRRLTSRTRSSIAAAGSVVRS